MCLTGGVSHRSTSRLAILWSFARPHARVIGGALVLGLVASSMELATPLVTKAVLDALTAGGSITLPVVALLALLVVGAVVSYVQWRLLGTVAEDIVLDARRTMVGRFLSAKVLPLVARPTGELVTRVTSDSVLLREAASSSLVGLVNGSVVLVGTLALMAWLDLTLFGVTVGALAVVGTLFAVLAPAIATAQERAQSSLADLGAGTEGTLRAIKTVKAAVAEDRQRVRLLDDAERARDHGVVAARREVLAWTVAQTGVQAAIVAVLAFGAARVASGDLAASTLVAFLLYAFGLMGPVLSLSQDATALQAGVAAAGRIREIDALPAEVAVDTVDSLDSGTVGGPVVLRDVTARYEPDGPRVLDGVSLTVPERGHVALVGPSGAGKTSILFTVLGFLEPESGQVLAGTTPYEHLDHAQIRRRLAYVEQESPVVPGTVRENLLFTRPDASQADLDRVLRELRLDDLVDRLPQGLDTPLSNVSVSGGQRQRIAFARALLAEPDVLLLDEATAQVDGTTEAAIHDAIRRQARRGAVLTVAHRLSTVVDADEIVVVEAGRVSDRGTHEQLMASSALYRGLVDALTLPSVGGRAPSAG